MIQLNDLQANFLKACFEEVFDEDEKYFDLIDIEDVYSILIGDESDEDFYIKLERTATIDDRNLSFILFVSEWMPLIEKISSRLEYFELSANSVEFKNKITEIIRTI